MIPAHLRDRIAATPTAAELVAKALVAADAKQLHGWTREAFICGYLEQAYAYLRDDALAAVGRIDLTLGRREQE